MILHKEIVLKTVDINTGALIQWSLVITRWSGCMISDHAGCEAR